MRALFVCFLPAVFACTAAAQEFEVVSVKPNKSESGSSSTHSGPGSLTATNVSLRSLILTAYGLKDYQVEGPDWLGSQRFDILAKFPEALPKDREKYSAGLQAMVQKMLADRFKLAVHRDRKTFPVYGLIVGKNGIKFKEVPDTGSHNSSSGNNQYKGTCISMGAFAEFLARRMDMPVLDMTELKGFYDLTLNWVPEPRQGADGKGDVPAVAEGPTIPVALQEQLGLKLETRKAPIEILIVDHVEKAPTEN